MKNLLTFLYIIHCDFSPDNWIHELALVIFVRKVDNEDGIQLPFTYIGMGKMEYIEGSKKANGAHLFRVPMEATAPEDIDFDFKLPE